MFNIIKVKKKKKKWVLNNKKSKDQKNKFSTIQKRIPQHWMPNNAKVKTKTLYFQQYKSKNHNNVYSIMQK